MPASCSRSKPPPVFDFDPDRLFPCDRYVHGLIANRIENWGAAKDQIQHPIPHWENLAKQLRASFRMDRVLCGSQGVLGACAQNLTASGIEVAGEVAGTPETISDIFARRQL